MKAPVTLTADHAAIRIARDVLAGKISKPSGSQLDYLLAGLANALQRYEAAIAKERERTVGHGA